MRTSLSVGTAGELLEALRFRATDIEILGTITGIPMVTLNSGGHASGKNTPPICWQRARPTGSGSALIARSPLRKCGTAEMR